MWAILKFVCIGIPIVYIFGLIVVLTWQTRLERWMIVYQKLASRYGGEVDLYQLRPRLQFHYHGMKSLLTNQDLADTPLEKTTTMQVTLSDGKLPRLVAFGAGQTMRVRGSKGMRSFKVGISKIDQRFKFLTSNPRRAAKLLNSAWLERLDELQSRFPKHAVVIEMSPCSMTIMRSGLIRDEKDLDDFVRLSLKLVEATRYSAVEGVEFYSNLVFSLRDSVRCPICTETPRGKIVLCASCNTPHCLDCWQYNGRCGIFACGETRANPSE